MKFNNMQQLDVSNFDYELPGELIAQHPLPERSSSRLLHLNRTDQSISHQSFKDVVSLLQPNDLLVLNNTKVIPARLFGVKASGGKIECLFERVLPNNRVFAHIRSSKSPRVGSEIILMDDVTATVVGRADDLFELQFSESLDLWDFLDRCGRMPLPPYITRDPDKKDYERYQTVYAQHKGAVAAPTAGLHFDDNLLRQIKQKGITINYLTLHVGAGTFQPIRNGDLGNHVMHAEIIKVDQALCEAVSACKERGGRVVAVGTTVVRALESAAKEDSLKPFEGDTRLFITPGFDFNVVDALITNFHLPQSTLLMLVSAFADLELIHSAYEEAIANRYRFFSYGDAMFIT